ncbi:MAG: hypothetical protein JSS93_11430 [Bacteroidetes bacterium]|nr:hypothetical protein [Bacteroidota bacterium]
MREVALTFLIKSLLLKASAFLGSPHQQTKEEDDNAEPETKLCWGVSVQKTQQKKRRCDETVCNDSYV